MQENNIEEIQNTMFLIYSKNLNFFKNDYPEIYMKILDLEKKNIYEYSIDFINNHFELVNNKNEYIYNCDPYYDAEYRLKNINEGSSFSLIKTDKEYDQVKTYDFRIDPYAILNNYIEIIKNKNVCINQKCIFLGSILGLHISSIVKESDFKIFLIIEDNLEIFRLSMFLNDYEDISIKKKIFFMINEKNKSDKIIDLLQISPEYNNKIRFELASEKDFYLIEEVLNIFLQENEINYPFSEYLISYIRGITYIKNNYNLLKLNTSYSILKGHRILFLGGGLSFEKEIDFIIRNKNNFLIVCVAAVLKILEKYDIVPIIIITSDSSNVIKEQFLANDKYYTNTIILASNKTDENVIRLFSKENVFLFNDSLELFNDTGVNTGVNVGNIGYSILLKLGVDSIYLLGFDACIDQNSKKSHSTKIETTEYKSFDLFKEEKVSSETHLIKVKGNFRSFVYTTNHFKGMIDSFVKMKNDFNVNAYNLSDGAFLDGIKPLKPSNLSFNSLYTTNNEIILKKGFRKISKNDFTTLELSLLNNEKALIQLLKNLDKLELYTNFMNLYKKNENSLLLQILNKYFLLVLPYYNYSKQIDIFKANNLLINNFYDIIDFIDNNF